MTCSRCGKENEPGARFCSNCANPLGVGDTSPEAGAADTPGPPEVATAAPASGSEAPTVPGPVAIPPPSEAAAAAAPTAEIPAGRPAGLGDPPKGGGPTITLTGPSLIAAAVAVLLLAGGLAWALATRGGGAEPVRAAGASPATSPTPSPEVTSVATPTVTASPTASASPSESASPTVESPTPSESPSAATGASFTVFLCAGVEGEGSCTGQFNYDNGWTIPVDTPEFYVYVSGSGLQPGDVVAWTYQDPSGVPVSGQEAVFDPLGEEVLDFETFSFWDPWTLPEGRVWTANFVAVIVITHNGANLTFGGPLSFEFV